MLNQRKIAASLNSKFFINTISATALLIAGMSFAAAQNIAPTDTRVDQSSLRDKGDLDRSRDHKHDGVEREHENEHEHDRIEREHDHDHDRIENEREHVEHEREGVEHESVERPDSDKGDRS